LIGVKSTIRHGEGMVHAGGGAVPGFGDALSVEHDAVPGRLRLRAPGLRGHHGRARAVEGWLAAHPAIRLAEVRAATGSIVLRHDPGMGRAAILGQVRAALAAPPMARPAGRDQTGTGMPWDRPRSPGPLMPTPVRG
jgi:hypothetical protein